MSRATYVIRDGKCVEKHLAAPYEPPVFGRSAAVIPDIDPFVSPIDRSLINSRAQYRDHCKRHDVVPTQDLAGMPTSRAQSATERKKESEARKQMIANQLYRR